MLAGFRYFALGCLILLGLTGPAGLRAQNPDQPPSPMAALEPFVGIWKIDRPPRDGVSDEYHVLEWDLNKAVLALSEYQRKDGIFRRYVAGLIGWNPLTQRIEFQEHADWGNFNRGDIEVLGKDHVRRHNFVHYKVGAALHWRETWRMGEDGDRCTTAIDKLERGEWKEGAPTFTSIRASSLPKE